MLVIRNCNVLILAALLGSPLHAEPGHAFVLALNGTWSVQGRPGTLAVGSAVPAPSELVIARAAPGNHIVIVAARSGAVLLAHECAGAADCRKPVTLPAPSPAPSSSTLGEQIERVMRRLEGAPDRYVATMSREGRMLQEAVLPLQDGEVDLTPALANLPAGRFETTLQRLDCVSPCDESASLRMSIDWRPGAAARAPAPGLRAGVHKLLVRSLARAAPSPPRRAHVLLVAGPDAPGHAARFDEWVALARSWGDTVDAATRQALLHAAMDELAERP
ncbi:MAG: hypothetical protein JNJ89_00390 [Rubrivivax sp.]|nr:hypothetical protein [Rubrivivax sp.]